MKCQVKILPAHLILKIKYDHTYMQLYGAWDGCGGVLLNCDPPVILTAAHCVQSRQPEEVMVALGIHNLDNLKKNTTTIYQVENIIIHPEFGP